MIPGACYCAYECFVNAAYIEVHTSYIIHEIMVGSHTEGTT